MTPVTSQVEIHFHNQDRASIFLETGAIGPMELYGELALAQYLAGRRPSDSSYLNMLCKVAQLSGHFSAIRAIKPYNHYQIGTSIVKDALAPLAERFNQNI